MTSTAVVAMVTGGIAFTALALLTGPITTPSDDEPAQAAMTGEPV
jgi:hypothetical protein